MRNMVRALMIISAAVPIPVLAADIPCPLMPAAITKVQRDVYSDVSASVGSPGKLKAGELSIKTEVFAKNVFENHPNVEKLLPRKQ